MPIRFRPAMLAAALALAACAPSEWQELVIRDGGFSVLMRGAPLYDRREIATPAGTIVAHLYSSDRPDSVVAVGYSDYPLALVLQAGAGPLLAGVRDTWVRRVNGRLTRSDDGLRIDGRHPGVEFVADGTVNGRPAFVHARLYLVEQRLYQVVVMGSAAEVPQGVVNRYLHSFRLVPQQDVTRMTVEPGKR
jgi:hypothetical protein